MLAGAGVGGGSLVYANTLYVPPDAFFDDPQWASITDWAAELAPLLRPGRPDARGGQHNPVTTAADRVMRDGRRRHGRRAHLPPTPVGVFFGETAPRSPAATVPDPFFGGAGPRRTGCTECGPVHDRLPGRREEHPGEELPALAERAGATVDPLTHRGRPAVRPRPAAGRPWPPGDQPSGPARLAGARTGGPSPPGRWCSPPARWGTQQLLHRMQAAARCRSSPPGSASSPGPTPRRSLGAPSGRAAGDADLTRGVAITSSIHPDADTHIETVRYGKGSQRDGLARRADGRRPAGGATRSRQRCSATLARHPLAFGLRRCSARRWSRADASSRWSCRPWTTRSPYTARRRRCSAGG